VTGLAQYDRDRLLPARGGDVDLCLPGDDEFMARHTAALSAALSGEAPRAVVLQHARWKPGTSIAGTWLVLGESSASARVTLKRYRGDKALLRANRTRLAAGTWVDAPGRSMLFTSAADLDLGGLAVAVSHEGKRKLARLGHENDVFGAAAVSKRASHVEVLRYKPERRAVCRFDARLRTADGPSEMRPVGLRILPVREAERIVRLRTELARRAGPTIQPRLLFTAPHLGWIAEEWLPGQVDANAAHGCAPEAGERLAELHATAIPEFEALELEPLDFHFDAGLFAIDPELARAAEELSEVLSLRPPMPPAEPVWCHADFHSDQLILAPGSRPRLLDFDALCLGPRERDLATWIADTLSGLVGSTMPAAFEEAASPLLSGYGRGITPALKWYVARALGRLAEGAVRRIERHALPKAGLLLERAREVVRP
jgi:hypothetical protein